MKVGREVAMQADLEKDDRKLPNAWIAQQIARRAL
jgi:hypothetical protein